MSLVNVRMFLVTVRASMIGFVVLSVITANHLPFAEFIRKDRSTDVVVGGAVTFTKTQGFRLCKAINSW